MGMHDLQKVFHTERLDIPSAFSANDGLHQRPILREAVSSQAQRDSFAQPFNRSSITVTSIIAEMFHQSPVKRPPRPAKPFQSSIHTPAALPFKLK